MKYYGMRFFLLATAFAIFPLYESGAASIDDLLGRTYFEIAPAFSYGLKYEDNIDGDRDGKDRISDWSNHYKPAVDISAFGPRFSLSSHAGLDIAEYTSEKNFNYVDQEYSVTLGYLPNERLEYSLGAGYTVITDNSRLEDIGDVDPTDEYTRYKDKTLDFNGGFSYTLTPRSTIGLTGTLTQYDTIATDTSDFYTLMGTYTYSLSPRTNLMLNTAYFYYDFKGNNSTFDSDEFYYSYSNYSYTFNNYSITGGFEHTFENDGKLLANAGLRYSDIRSSERTNTGTVKTSGSGNGWVAVLEYQKRFNDFLFGFEAHQDISVSSQGSNYDGTSFSSRTEYRINQRLAADLVLGFARAYADSGDDEFIGEGRDTRTYFVRPSLSYKAYRWLLTDIGYLFRYTQDKGQNTGTRHANIFYVNLKFIPLRNLVLR